MEPSAF